MRSSTLLKRQLRYLETIREYIGATESLSSALADQRNFNNLYRTLHSNNLDWHAVIQHIGGCSGINSEKDYLGLIWLELITKYGLDGKPTEENLAIIEISMLTVLDIARRSEANLSNLLAKTTATLFGHTATKDWDKFRAALVGTCDICFCDIDDGSYRKSHALRQFLLKKLQGQEFQKMPMSPAALLNFATEITDIPVPQP